MGSCWNWLSFGNKRNFKEIQTIKRLGCHEVLGNSIEIGTLVPAPQRKRSRPWDSHTSTKNTKTEVWKSTVDGSDIRRSPVEVGSLSHYLQGFIYPRWCRMSSINNSFVIFLRYGLGRPPAQHASHHQDYYIFSRGSL